MEQRLVPRTMILLDTEAGPQVTPPDDVERAPCATAKESCDAILDDIQRAFEPYAIQSTTSLKMVGWDFCTYFT